MIDSQVLNHDKAPAGLLREQIHTQKLMFGIELLQMLGKPQINRIPDWHPEIAGQGAGIITNGMKRAVVIAGVTDDGYLHGKTVDGGVPVELEPDGNTFDMMRGLIQRKL